MELAERTRGLNMKVTYVERGPVEAEIVKKLVIGLASDNNVVTYRQINDKTEAKHVKAMLSSIEIGGRCVFDFISEEVVGQMLLDLVLERRMPEGKTIHPESELYLIHHLPPPAQVQIPA